MKKIITSTLFLFFSIPFIFAQSKNDSLYNAVVKNDTLLITYWIEKGADVNFSFQKGWVNVSPLITAVNNNHIDAAKILLSHKADTNWEDGFKATALMYAASKGNIRMVQLLIDHGADIKHKDNQGNDAISTAKDGKHIAVVKLLKKAFK